MYSPDKPKTSTTRAKKKSSVTPAAGAESEPEEAPAKATKSKSVDPDEFLGTRFCYLAMFRTEIDVSMPEHLLKNANAPIYGLFAQPTARYKNKRPVVTFQCLKCKTKLDRFLDTKDKTSSSNLRKHGKTCWGSDVIELLGRLERITPKESRKAARGYLTDQDITRFLPKTDSGGNRVTNIISYSHKQLTLPQTR